MKYQMIIMFLFFAMILSNCEKNLMPVTQNAAVVDLQVEEVMVTEAWLKLSVQNLQPDQQAVVWRDSLEILRSNNVGDTVIYDNGLQPAHTYNYRAAGFYNQQQIANSQLLPLTTMDTTSHDFNWELIEIPSPFGSAMLKDVAIINENDIWAVGEIYADSAQPSLPYNALHWDGQQWEMRKIFVDYQGQPNLAPLEGVFALSDAKILFLSGLPYLPESDHWKLYHLWDMGVLNQNDGGVSRVWGTSLKNLYFAGRKGAIVHYNGSSWRKLESGTDLPIQDIWGAKNERSGEYEIFCVASDKYHNVGKELLKIKDFTVTTVNDSGLSWALSSIWFVPGKRYYIAGAGIYPKRDIYSRIPWVRYPSGEVTSYFSNRIRGNSINDVAAAGAFGEIVHFNGITWKNYYTETQLSGSYYGLDMKNNLIVAVGQGGSNGAITIGRRH